MSAQRSRAPEPPYCWQNKEAFRQIESTYDSESSTRLACAAYLSLTRIASDKQAESFECSVKEIASYMHYRYDQTLKGIQLAEAAGVIRVERRKVAGTSENAPSVYTLLEVIGKIDKVIGKIDKVIDSPRIAVNPESIEVTEKEQRSNREEKVTLAPVAVTGDPPPLASDSRKKGRYNKKIPVTENIDAVGTAWSAKPNLLRIRDLSAKRRKAIAARLKDPFFAEHYAEAIAKVAASAFCNGHNERQWRADIDWLLKPDTVLRVIEGKYDGHAPAESDLNLVTPDPGQPTVDEVNRAAWERRMKERAEREAAELEHSP